MGNLPSSYCLEKTDHLSFFFKIYTKGLEYLLTYYPMI